MPDSPLVHIFHEEGLLTSDQLSTIQERLARTGDGILTAALDERFISFETVSRILKQYAEIETCDLTGLTPEAETSKALGHFYCEKYCVLPIACQVDDNPADSNNWRLYVAMRDPLCERTLAALSHLTGMCIEPLLAREEDIRYAINTAFGSERINDIASRFTLEDYIRKSGYVPEPGLAAQLQNAPAVRLIDSLIESAVLYRASDIHIEPFDRRLRARYRVDGTLTTFQQVDVSLLPYVISRLKVMGCMDIAEKRLPQDGHFTMRLGGEDIDFRLSTLPTLYGEKAVIRLLYDKKQRLKKDDLGFFPQDIAPLTRLFNSAYGAVFMTGPTGSGKSTTLNCFLEELNTDEVNIVTVEDPVENPLPGVNHMNVEPAAGLHFANALRHILRQDPDIIMIGEIRDPETARIAVQAAITGHLVLSTLHTNDAAGVMERLVDMGIEPYLAAAALNGVISQRLVKQICRHCITPTPLTPEESLLLRVPADTPAFTGKGCGRCNHTGYKGRFAVYEYIIMDERLRRKMSSDTPRCAAWLRRKRSGLRENGLANIRMGRTTASEVIRVLNRELQADAF